MSYQRQIRVIVVFSAMSFAEQALLHVSLAQNPRGR